MTPEEIWRRKSDEELLAANVRLSEYSELGRQIIVAEMDRRGLSDSGTMLDAERLSDDTTREQCWRCDSVIQDGATYCWQCDARVRATAGDGLDAYTTPVLGLTRRSVDSHLHGECQHQNPAMIKAQRIQSSFSRAWVLVFQIYYLQHIINMQLVQDKSVVAA